MFKLLTIISFWISILLISKYQTVSCESSTNVLRDALTKEQIDCIIVELEQIGEEDPEALEWTQNAVKVLQDLSKKMQNCKTDLCKWRAQYEAYKKLKQLQKQIEDKPELSAKVQSAIQQCLSQGHVASDDFKSPVAESDNRAENSNDNVRKEQTDRIEVPAEAVQCIRERIIEVKERHPENEQFQQWADKTVVDLDKSVQELENCKGAKLCRRIAEYRAWLRFRKAMKALKEIDEDGALRAELDEALQDCYDMIDWD